MQWKTWWKRGASRASLLAVAATLAVIPGLAGQEDVELRAAQAIDATGGRDLEGWQKVRVRIENDLVPTRSVIVSVVTPTRPQLVLGMVRSNETREWEIDTRSFVGGFRLVAEGNPRDVVVSRGISVVGNALVRWDLGTGLVRVEQRDAEDADEAGADDAPADGADVDGAA